jgi:outer membrane protein assembly factor BamA
MEVPAPSKPGRLERALVFLENGGLDRLLKANLAGFRPKFGGLPSGSGLAFGIQYQPPPAGKDFDFRAAAVSSLSGYQLYQIRTGFFAPEHRGGYAYLDLAYRDYPREDFFGGGPLSRPEDRADFRLEQGSYEVVSGYRFNEWLQTRVRAGRLTVKLGPGTDPRFPDLETSDLGQPEFFHLATTVTLDYRDAPGNPHSGGVTAMELARFQGGTTRFDRWAVDSRHYLPLGSKTRVLALRFLARGDVPEAGSEVPFYFQRTLGGSQILRGFRNDRFRDARQLAFSGEYRWEALPALELALFYDIGNVFPAGAPLELRLLRKSAGFGLRFKSYDKVILRLDVGRSVEGTRYHFQFGPSF